MYTVLADDTDVERVITGILLLQEGEGRWPIVENARRWIRRDQALANKRLRGKSSDAKVLKHVWSLRNQHVW